MFKILQKKNNSYKKTFSDIGEVLFSYSNRAKRLSITIKPDGSIRVTIPNKIKSSFAESFLDSKKSWILKKKAYYEVEEVPDIEIIGLLESTNIIKDRIRELAKNHNYHFNKIAIKKMKTRWGSCSPANNINLNYLLASLPGHLMDYVILHELVHTEVKNHKKEFWEKLDRCFTGKKSKTLQKELRKYGGYLYRSAL